MMGRIAIATGVVVEDLGADLMVMVPGSPEVLTLTGNSANAVRRVQSGSPAVIDAAVSDLVRLGVLETTGLSRRGLVKAGAIGAGAGIAVMAMPSVAAASSGSYDLLGYWGGVTESTAAVDDTIVGVTFFLASENQLVSASLLLDGATVSIVGVETDYAALEIQLGLDPGYLGTGYSYDFDSVYPRLLALPAPRETTLDPDDPVFRALVQQLANGTAGGAVFGTLTAGGTTYRVKFEYGG
jgi:hypothetical protein